MAQSIYLAVDSFQQGAHAFQSTEYAHKPQDGGGECVAFLDDGVHGGRIPAPPRHPPSGLLRSRRLIASLSSFGKLYLL